MAETTYRVHGGLHHNGVHYPHGATVPASLFRHDNVQVGDELAALLHAGTLKTEAEFLPATQLQSALDDRDAEILRLKGELEAAQKAKTEAAEKRDEAMEKARTEGTGAEAAEEQFPKSTL